MSVTEGDRRQIYVKLEEFVGEDVANNIMKLLPYQPNDELATRADLAGQTNVLHGDMAELRAEMRNEMAELRTEMRGEMAELGTGLRNEMAELRAEMRGEMAGIRAEMVELRTDMRLEMAELRAEMRADAQSELRVMQRWAIGILLANMVAVAAAVIGPVLL